MFPKLVPLCTVGLLLPLSSLSMHSAYNPPRPKVRKHPCYAHSLKGDETIMDPNVYILFLNGRTLRSVTVCPFVLVACAVEEKQSYKKYI